MIEMSLAEVAAVTGGRLHRATGTERVTGVEFDSRKVGPGGLFLALPGERVDGHAFAAVAVAAGAVAVLAAREVDAPAVLVPLRMRAAWRRAATSPPPTPTVPAPRSSPRWPVSPRTTSPC